MPPGLPRYTETYDKSNATEPSWAMRRDLRLGTTSGQIFMTTGEADTSGLYQGQAWALARAEAGIRMLELELTFRAQLLPLPCCFFRRHAHPACAPKPMLGNNHSGHTNPHLPLFTVADGTLILRACSKPKFGHNHDCMVLLFTLKYEHADSFCAQL
jgi:hypothetical protein